MPRVITHDRVLRMIQSLAEEEQDLVRRKQLMLPENTQILDLTELGATGVDANAFQSFAKLHRLDLSNNKLKSVNGVFGRMGESDGEDVLPVASLAPAITWLKLSSNKLNKSGLTGVSTLRQLTTLTLSHNSIRKIPKNALAKLVNLKALVLDHNEIETVHLPKTLKNLNSLILSNNKIKHLPVEVLERLPALTKLSLSHNEMESFPDVSKNTNLAEVRIAHNLVTVVEVASLGDLNRLKIVDLSSNKIDAWASIAPLHSLSLVTVSLRKNPLCADIDEGADAMNAYVSKAVETFPTLKNLDFKPIAKLAPRQAVERDNNNVNQRFAEQWKRKQLKREKNLISTKLHQPDASKPRNKPCTCGSGIKYKLCCEKKEAQSQGSQGQDKVSNEAAKPSEPTVTQVPDVDASESKDKSPSSESSHKSSKKRSMPANDTAQQDEEQPSTKKAREQDRSNDDQADPSKDDQADPSKIDDDEDDNNEEKQRLLDTLSQKVANKVSGVVETKSAKKKKSKKSKRAKSGAELASALKRSKLKIGEGSTSAWD